MGRVAIPISVDVEKVKQVFGSKDEALFKKILSSLVYKQFDEDYSFKSELQAIIFNYVSPDNRIVKPKKMFGLVKGDDGRGLQGDWNDYGYAVLAICCSIGKRFSEIDKDFMYNDNWWKINTLLRENKCTIDLSRMHQSRQIFDTPYVVDDIYTNLYTKEEVEHLVKAMYVNEDKVEHYNFELYHSFRKGLLHSQENKLDVLVFSFEV